jgi:hypothetical protein
MIAPIHLLPLDGGGPNATDLALPGLSRMAFEEGVSSSRTCAAPIILPLPVRRMTCSPSVVSHGEQPSHSKNEGRACRSAEVAE